MQKAVKQCCLIVFLISLALLPGNTPVASAGSSHRTVTDVLRNIGPKAEGRLKAFFDRAGTEYPPSSLTLIGLKEEMELELWTRQNGRWVYVHTYEILAASGDAGPKRKRGDRQVPEGIYHITCLNPNSRYHLSMKVDYPNSFDLEKARQDRRANPGGDIYIHGRAKSDGCIAIGDTAIEELFTLMSRVGMENAKVIILPRDIRRDRNYHFRQTDPTWLPELYDKLRREVADYPPEKARL